MKKIAFMFACVAVTAFTAPVLAHHSAAAFDGQKKISVTGKVVEYRYMNPHIYLTLEVTKDDGTKQRMEVEAGAASVLNALGFTKDKLKIGDIVTIAGSPSRREPDRLMLGRDMTKQKDNSYVPLNISSRSIFEVKTDAVATSIAGTWFSPMSSFGAYNGTAGKWARTDQARAIGKQNADPKATTQKDCIPIGLPATMFYPVATTIDVQKDKVVIKVDWMDTTRTVYLDGRKHPPASQQFLHGHSVGHWEGKTLVVETTNFTDHPMGLSTGVPSSSQKKLNERFTLNEDGKSLTYSGTVEDPVYLTQPAQWSGRLEYRPGMPQSNQKCNVEVARKFLSD
jgi:uncharacterized protein DUF6152